MAGDRAQSLRLFQTHNRVQLSRLVTLAPHPQPLFFQLLPLILHGNFKLLPGYVSDNCPVGIVDYQPETESLRAASNVDRNFQFRQRALRRYAIRGVYLISNFNGLSYPQPGRFTLWLVHQAQLAAEAQQELARKLTAITSWAAELGIQLKTLLVSEADVRLQPDIQSDLTNFYLNGLVIAGSLPLWWMIAAEEQADYPLIADRLLTQHQLSHNNLLDFGASPPLTAQPLLDNLIARWFAAFFGSAREDLELLFAAQQCLSFPDTVDLTQLLKQAITSGETDSTALSKAHLQFAHLATVLESESLQRARQSLYLQTNERLSNKVLHPTHPWRRQFISAAAANWQWSAQQLRNLDQPRTLGIRTLLKQPAQRWQWLAEILSAAQQFARQQSLDDTRIKTARKHLALKQQPPADVISDLMLAAVADTALEQLNLNRLADNNRWQLSDLPAGNGPQQALYSDKALVNVLAFAIINGLLTHSSWLRVNDPQPQLESHHILELSQLLMRSALGEPLPPPQPDLLQQPATTCKIIVLANLLPAPPDYLQQQGLQMSSNQNDPLSFSSAQINLLASIDILLLSSWGQWHHLQFSGDDAVCELLDTLLRWQTPADICQDMLCWCPTPIHGQAISQRLQGLISDMLTFHHRSADNGRYLLRSGRQYWQIQWQDALIESQAVIPSPAQWLSQSATKQVASRVDPWLDKQGKLNALQG